MDGSDSIVHVCFHAIGYNKKGLIGFVTGGTMLTYMEMVDENKKLVEEKHLPYILDSYVKDTNRTLKKKKKDAKK